MMIMKEDSLPANMELFLIIAFVGGVIILFLLALIMVPFEDIRDRVLWILETNSKRSTNPMKIQTSFRGFLAKNNKRINFNATWNINTPLLLSPQNQSQVHEDAKETIFGAARLLVARTTTKQISKDRERFFDQLFDRVNAGLLEQGLELVGFEDINEIIDEDGNTIYRNPYQSTELPDVKGSLNKLGSESHNQDGQGGYPVWSSRSPMTINLSLKNSRARGNVPVDFSASFKIAFYDQTTQSNAEHPLQGIPPSTIEAGTREILQEASEQAIFSMNIEQINVTRDVFIRRIFEIGNRKLERLLLKIIDLEIFSTTDDNGFIPPLGLGDRIFGTIEMTIRSNMQQIGLRIIPDYGDARWEIDSIRLQNRLAAVETSPSPDLGHSKIRFNFGNTAFYLARKLSWKAVSSAHRWENGKWVELYSNKKGDTFELEDIDSLLENDN